MNNNYYYSHTI